MMENVALWQGLTICGIGLWIVVASCLNVTQKLRSLFQPWVAQHVVSSTHLIIKIQNYQHGFLDGLFSALSCVVSVPFYTAFLPLLFWSGHTKLARQMTLLMVFCDYIGNCIKDVISAPRPSCPPVRRITATKDEEDNALEYGLPSSHTLNTVCLSGYLLHYVLSYAQIQDVSLQFVGFSIVCVLVGLIGLGRIYLGMHSLIDIIGGLFTGLVILCFWLTVNEYIDSFIVSGQNVTTFWAALSFLFLFAYPTPELPTPSFEYHTAFDGVAFGIVAGIQQTFHQFHHEAVPRVFTPQVTVLTFLGRVLVGIPTILTVKFCSKALARRILPVVSKSLGIPIKSTCYIPMLNGSVTDKNQQPGYIKKLFFFTLQDSFDVDTGIRFLQYAGLAWSPAILKLVGDLAKVVKVKRKGRLKTKLKVPRHLKKLELMILEIIQKSMHSKNEIRMIKDQGGKNEEKVEVSCSGEEGETIAKERQSNLRDDPEAGTKVVMKLSRHFTKVEGRKEFRA